MYTRGNQIEHNSQHGKTIIRTLYRRNTGMFTTAWIFSIVKCEILTSKYGAEFIGLELQTNMLSR